MTREPPPNSRSLSDRVRNLSRAHGLAEGRVRRLLGVVIVGQLLVRTDAAVLKGATNLEVRLGTASTRVSSDLDTVRRQSLVQFRDDLAVALRDGWNGFAGTLIDAGQIPTPTPDDYRPHRFRARLTYRDGDFVTLTLEVAAEEVDALEISDTVATAGAAEWFAELGLPNPEPIPTLALEHQIAQKLHACTAPDQPDWINDRAHDLVDLQLAFDLFDGDLAHIRRAATRLFASRRLHAWPPQVTPRQGWDERYRQEAQGLDVAATLDEAIDWANNLIAAIDGVAAPRDS
jgi:hypothetical protein